MNQAQPFHQGSILTNLHEISQRLNDQVPSTILKQDHDILEGGGGIGDDNDPQAVNFMQSISSSAVILKRFSAPEFLKDQDRSHLAASAGIYVATIDLPNKICGRYQLMAKEEPEISKHVIYLDANDPTAPAGTTYQTATAYAELIKENKKHQPPEPSKEPSGLDRDP